MSITRTLLRTAAVAIPALAVANALPAATTFGPARNRLMPKLSGRGRPDHVALTFDDGPDPKSTPRFLELLEARGVQATFFLLGSMLEKTPSLADDIRAAGHEIGVHGWHHHSLLLRTPRATYEDLARARDYIGDVTGTVPTLFRPPYGVMTASAHVAACKLAMTPVLWTAWGEDWRAKATPQSVYQTVTSDLHGGGTVLLHDSDCTATPDSWRSTLGALPTLLDYCADRKLAVGPLREHGVSA